MGLTLLPRLIVIAHWHAGFFDALAVVLEDEQARQRAHGSTGREPVVNGAATSRYRRATIDRTSVALG